MMVMTLLVVVCSVWGDVAIVDREIESSAEEWGWAARRSSSSSQRPC